MLSNQFRTKSTKFNQRLQIQSDREDTNSPRTSKGILKYLSPVENKKK
jgi:hypothetical protein